LAEGSLSFSPTVSLPLGHRKEQGVAIPIASSVVCLRAGTPLLMIEDWALIQTNEEFQAAREHDFGDDVPMG
jgi:hypothetical protein